MLLEFYVHKYSVILTQHVDFTKFTVITASYNISQQVMGPVHGSYIV